ncbi:MAG: glycosyltransferase family 2 protein [Bacillota bacterium]|jgi:glycosyltransferase involved in cell wall biosynthesis
MRTIAIIPAYNEEKTIARVVTAAQNSKYIDQVVVVNDGSEDHTSQMAESAGAVVLEMGCNRGKGAAIQAGLQRTDSEVILFLDADLIGLTSAHIDTLLAPVISGQVDMTLGVFDHGRAATDLAQKITPFLSGQRAIKRSILRQLPSLDELGFGVEVALTRFVKSNGIAYQEVILPEVSQVTKEEKFGLLDGFTRRLRMYWDIVRALAQ